MTSSDIRMAHAIAGRFLAGDSVRAIAYDFEATLPQIQASLRWSLAHAPRRTLARRGPPPTVGK
jgi:uncharacterized protein (DUF433 family)